MSAFLRILPLRSANAGGTGAKLSMNYGAQGTFSSPNCLSAPPRRHVILSSRGKGWSSEISEKFLIESTFNSGDGMFLHCHNASCHIRNLASPSPVFSSAPRPPQAGAPNTVAPAARPPPHHLILTQDLWGPLSDPFHCLQTGMTGNEGRPELH